MNRPTLIALALSAAQALPSLAAAQPVQLSAGFMPDPRRTNGMAGGMVQAGQVPGGPGNCRGFIPGAPQQIIQTPTGFNFLRIIAQPLAGTDLTLMVRGTSQTWCADDTYGNVPGLDLQALPPGRYDVYVGTYSQSGPAPYQLLMSELQGTMPDNNGVRPQMPVQPQFPQPQLPQPQANTSALGSLDFTGRPLFGRMMVAGNFMSRSVRGRNGGALGAEGITGQGTCRGFFQGPPSHVVFLAQPRDFLRMYVVSAADSTLVVRRPDGQVLCNDDTYQLNPGVEGNFPAGLYQVWVGTYRAGESRPYQLTVTVDPSQHP
jgi:hypothetical protein